MPGMCHDDDSRPPSPPIQGEVASRSDLRLTALDGNRLLAHAARAGSPSGIGVVIMPDVRGLHAYYGELAARFAEAGIDAVAIEYFGRTADTYDRSEAFEYRRHVDKTTSEDRRGRRGWRRLPAHRRRRRRGASLHRRLLLRRRALLGTVGRHPWARRLRRLLRQAGTRGGQGRPDDDSAAHADGWRGQEHPAGHGGRLRRQGPQPWRLGRPPRVRRGTALVLRPEVRRAL